MCGILSGNSTADCYTPYNGRLKVALVVLLGECKWKLLDTK